MDGLLLVRKQGNGLGFDRDPKRGCRDRVRIDHIAPVVNAKFTNDFLTGIHIVCAVGYAQCDATWKRRNLFSIEAKVRATAWVGA